VAELQSMGLSAVRAEGQPGPRVGDGLVVGYFVSVDPGSATERVVLGFGAGGSELKTVVKGYLMTAEGLRALGSGEVEAGSGKMPGGAVRWSLPSRPPIRLALPLPAQPRATESCQARTR
jgi:Domain of unknown function (DUF4410)